MGLNRFRGSSSDVICVEAAASARNASTPSPNSSNVSSIRTISLRDRARRWSALTRPFPVQSRHFFHSSIDRRYNGPDLSVHLDILRIQSKRAQYKEGAVHERGSSGAKGRRKWRPDEGA